MKASRDLYCTFVTCVFIKYKMPDPKLKILNKNAIKRVDAIYMDLNCIFLLMIIFNSFDYIGTNLIQDLKDMAH